MSKKKFLDKVNKTKSCWLWTAAIRGNNGYGAVRFRGNVWLAHRAAYTLFNGEIPKGMLVCHTCDNRKCVNPEHLFLGTHKDNSVDAYKKGRVTMPKGNEFKPGEQHPNHKLTNQQVLDIRARYAAGGISLRKLAKEYAVDHSCVWQIVRGIRSHVWVY